MWIWMSECVLFFIARFLLLKYPHRWCTNSAIRLLHVWCHVKLLPSQRTCCLHHTTMHKFTVSVHSKCYTQDACAFSCNLPRALLAEWLLRAAAITQGWNGYRNKSQRRRHTPSIAFRHPPPWRKDVVNQCLEFGQKVDSGVRRFSHRSYGGLEPAIFGSRKSGALTTELFPLPADWWLFWEQKLSLIIRWLFLA